MTDNNHPITPPLELVQQWNNDWHRSKIKYDSYSLSAFVATQAARWGADEQLEMDAVWVALQTSNQMSSKRLIAEMRPKPPSLKAQALAAHGAEPLPEVGPTGDTILNAGAIERHRLIRRALEQLND